MNDLIDCGLETGLCTNCIHKGGFELLVNEMMNKNVVTLKPTDTIGKAIQLFREKNIRHLPVINEDDHCIGIISDRDIRSAVPSSLLQFEEMSKVLNQTVDTIMVKDVITVHPLDFFEEAAVLFNQYRIGCLPVESENKLVGIITQTDIIQTFITLTGTDQPGSQIEVRLHNQTGQLAELTRLISNENINILSVLIYPDQIHPNDNIIVLRLSTINPLPVIKSLENHGVEVIFPKLKEYPI